ncbi:hypothetical protein roselon_02459 [Roseibacterium elongatum DSM 19469]|uniref:FecR protein domain-containing protein n=1 Tax=Roseicyclus elongatus DSM 19469 TaxID=1294273 RepID=W8S3K0_9RHOB|nr:hypothetical protein roselon_02459 [Roseibacterium elongatum DSM 19469]
MFDPNQGAGEMGLQLTEGALRFIGGTLSRDEPATITTPSATIGVRGSSALVFASGGDTYAVFIAGERLCLATASGGTACTSRQGGVLGNDGYLGEVSPQFLAFLLQLIDGAPQSGGGAGLGSGVDTPNPSDRGPVSTGGEEFDFDLFEDGFDIDTIIGFFAGEECLPFFYEELGTNRAAPNEIYEGIFCFGGDF